MKASSHDKINLARLLTRLDKLVHHSAEPLKDRPWWEVRKLNDDARYARELLDSVAALEAGQGNRGEGPSTTLDEYELKLNRISMSLILATSDPAIPKGPVYTVLPPSTISLAPPAFIPSDEAPLSPELALSPTPMSEPSKTTLSTSLSSSPVQSRSDLLENGIRPEPALEQPAVLPPHLSNLGTLPPPTTLISVDEGASSSNLSARAQLGLRERRTLRNETRDVVVKNKGGMSEGLMSTSRVHDELTEQLAMMSTQLRKNATHFASSLEAEKPLLEQSSALLESNLTKLVGSKGRLEGIKGKGRGNTWLVLGAVGTVCLVWVWMYFLIRFT